MATALAASGLLMAAGAASASAATQHYTFSGLSAGEYYGPVECSGKFIVSKKFPAGKEVEKCVSKSASGKFEGLTGSEEGSGATGGFPFPGSPNWESDDPAHAGLQTGDFSYKVSPSDTKFRLIAIY